MKIKKNKKKLNTISTYIFSHFLTTYHFSHIYLYISTLICAFYMTNYFLYNKNELMSIY